MFGRDKRLSIDSDFDKRFADAQYAIITEKSFIAYAKFLRKYYLAYVELVHNRKEHFMIGTMDKKITNPKTLGRYWPIHKRTGKPKIEYQLSVVDILEDGWETRVGQDYLEQDVLRNFRIDFPRFANSYTYFCEKTEMYGQGGWLFIHLLILHEMAHHLQHKIYKGNGHDKYFKIAYRQLLENFDFVLLFVNFVEKKYKHELQHIT